MREPQLPVRMSRNSDGAERIVASDGSVLCAMMNGFKAETVISALNKTGKLSLPDVTLVMIETQEHELAAMAVEDCLRHAEFGDVLVFTDDSSRFTPILPPGGRCLPVENWDTKIGWSKFSWHGTWEHIQTSHALYIQWDSWVIDPGAWRDVFLNYDIVGAPWWYEENNVGGLGFSLRSRRILKFLAEHQDEFPIISDFDDDLICRNYRQGLESHGFIWAPAETAWDFAFECVRPPTVLVRHFGFHGIGNWPLVLPWERLRERVEVVRRSQYLRYSGHMSMLADLLVRYATEHERRIADLTANADVAHYYSAIRRLSYEDYENGWREYEIRWKTQWFKEYEEVRQRLTKGGIKLWKGEPLTGQSILVWHEQGHGDSIMMQRYLPLLEQMADKVYVGVPEPLVSLFRANGHLAFNTVPAEYDYQWHISFYSLPHVFGTRRDTVPAACLHAPERPAKLIRSGKPLVGIYWHANDKFPHNDHRSMTFEQFSELLDPCCDYVALQYDLEEAGVSAAALSERRVQYVPFADFGELAALISELDLVVTVCSGVANLVGSLNRPIWALLAADRFRDMRWSRAGNSSPWYPQARIFRQLELDEWRPVVSDVRAALREFTQ